MTGTGNVVVGNSKWPWVLGRRNGSKDRVRSRRRGARRGSFLEYGMVTLIGERT